MVFEVKDLEVHTWYMGLSQDDDWKVAQTKGIAREQAVELIRQDVFRGHTEAKPSHTDQIPRLARTPVSSLCVDQPLKHNLGWFD